MLVAPEVTVKRINGSSHGEPPMNDESIPITRAALTKDELQNVLVDKIGLSKRECREVVNAIFDEMCAALEAGETVKLEGFGRFQPKRRPQRWARNLRSGERIAVAERRVVTFHPSKKLCASIENAREEDSSDSSQTEERVPL